MRGTTSRRHLEDEEEEHTSERPPETASITKRLDLNDLLKRIKDQRKNDKRTNFIILSSVVSVFLLFLLIISF